MVTKPYYEQDGIVIYHGDCREIAPQLSGVTAVAALWVYVTIPAWIKQNATCRRLLNSKADVGFGQDQTTASAMVKYDSKLARFMPIGFSMNHLLGRFQRGYKSITFAGILRASILNTWSRSRQRKTSGVEKQRDHSRIDWFRIANTVTR